MSVLCGIRSLLATLILSVVASGCSLGVGTQQGEKKALYRVPVQIEKKGCR